MAVYVNKDGNLQTVAIGIKDIVTLIDNKVPVKITSTEKSNYDSASLKAHEHGNKNILDKFSYNTSTNQLIYDGTPVTALTRSQIEDIIHDEVPIILSSDDKINYDDAVNKKHEHKNKDFLDSLSYDSLNNRIMYNDVGIVGAGLLRPEVEAVIDEKVHIKLTEEEKEGYDLAYKCLHTHDNHEILDKFGYNEKVGLTYDGKSLDGVTYDDVVQIINEEVPVKLTEDQENYYNDSASKAHEHDNLYVLEGLGYDEENETLLYNGKKATGGFSQKEIETIIDNKVPVKLSSSEKTRYETAYSERPTKEEREQLKEAYTNTHTHDNREIIDKFSYDTDNNLLLYDGAEIIGVASEEAIGKVVDEKVPVKLTTSDKSNYDSAVRKTHIHSNGNVLEKFTYDNESDSLYFNGTLIGGIAGGSNMTVKDVEKLIKEKVPIILSTEEYDDFNQAVDLSHSHANKSVLDLLSCEGKEVKFNGETIFTLSNAATSITEPDLEGVANASVTVSDQKLILTWTDPDNLTLNGKTATWKGTKVIMKAGSYPKSITDGTIVVDNQTKNKYQTNGFVVSSLNNDTTYYFKFFTYSDTENVSTNVVRLNGTPYRPPEYKVMTVVIDDLDSDPEKALTYADDAIGMTPGADEWDNTLIFKDIRPCVLRDGEVLYYLNKNDYTKREDGTDADITTLGNDVMIEIPKLGYRLTHTNNVTKVSVTNNPNGEEDGFCYYAHTYAEIGDSDVIYVGAYPSYFDITEKKFYSSSDKVLDNTQYNSELSGYLYNQKIFDTYIQRREGYSSLNFWIFTLLQCLYLIKYKNRDVHTAIGAGFNTKSTDNNVIGKVTTGLTNLDGMYYGGQTDEKGSKFLGIENLWGSPFSTYISNITTFNNGTYANRISVLGIKNIIKSFTIAGSLTSGFIKTVVGTNEHGFNPLTTLTVSGGSTSTYYCSYASGAGSSSSRYNFYIQSFKGNSQSYLTSTLFTFKGSSGTAINDCINFYLAYYPLSKTTTE